jgi:hypothetical protein
MRANPTRPQPSASCSAPRDNDVVEYALSRTLSPALVVQYQTQLPEKQLLAAKLHEFYGLNTAAPDA